MTFCRWCSIRRRVKHLVSCGGVLVCPTTFRVWVGMAKSIEAVVRASQTQVCWRKRASCVLWADEGALPLRNEARTGVLWSIVWLSSRDNAGKLTCVAAYGRISRSSVSAIRQRRWKGSFCDLPSPLTADNPSKGGSWSVVEPGGGTPWTGMKQLSPFPRLQAREKMKRHAAGAG